MTITITEALAEIKTVGKRITKKREFVQGYLARQEGVKDPLQKDGGSEKVIAEERQAIGDLEQRIIRLRRGIQKANDETIVEILGVSRSISEWLTWRRDIAPGQKQFLAEIRSKLTAIREQAKRTGSTVTAGALSQSEELKPTDIIVNVDERAIATELERIEETLGVLGTATIG